eukprot:1308415-Pyramimonas_sp.AAC.1
MFTPEPRLHYKHYKLKKRAAFSGVLGVLTSLYSAVTNQLLQTGTRVSPHRGTINKEQCVLIELQLTRPPKVGVQKGVQKERRGAKAFAGKSR